MLWPTRRAYHLLSFTVAYPRWSWKMLELVLFVWSWPSEGQALQGCFITISLGVRITERMSSWRSLCFCKLSQGKPANLKKKKHWVKGTEMPCLKTNGNQYYEQFMDYRKWQSNGQREVRLISTVSSGCSSSGCLALFVGMFDSLISRKPRPFWEFPLWNTEVWYLFFHQYIPWISASTLTWWKVRQIATCTKKIKPTFKT